MQFQRIQKFNRRQYGLLLCSAAVAVLVNVGLTRLLPALGDSFQNAPLTDSAERWANLLCDFLDACFRYLQTICTMLVCGLVLVRQAFLPTELRSLRRWYLLGAGILFLPWAYGIVNSAFTGALSEDPLNFLLFVALYYAVDLLAFVASLQLARHIRQTASPDDSLPALKASFRRQALFAAICSGICYLCLDLYWVIVNAIRLPGSMTAGEVILSLLSTPVQTVIVWLIFRLLGYDTLLFFKNEEKNK